MIMKPSLPIWLSIFVFCFSGVGCGNRSKMSMKGYFDATTPTELRNCTPGQLTEGPNGSKFAEICAGTFFMGSPNSQPDRNLDETPQHQVTISKSFEMQTTEVTQSQWATVMGTKPSYFEGSDHPVEMVSWYDTLEFIAKLNATRDGYLYRLPTEAEWEYAARAGNTSTYPENLDSIAWYAHNSDEETHPVATKKANAWGLYDIHGNVWEWTADRYGADYYKSSPEVDPMGPSSGDVRTIRGGAWGASVQMCRYTYRSRSLDTNRIFNLGFRLVRTRI